jgi:aerobic carbon-monoxide dehydrogenase medium subunit
MKTFDYLEPKSVEETSMLMGQHIGEAKILAGGTDLLIAMRYQKISPKYLIDIKGISELRCIQYSEDEGMRFGSLSTICDIGDSRIVKVMFPDLKQSALSIATPQIRNRGTVGGNLCNASPAADLAPSLIALESEVTLSKAGKGRVLKLEDFFVGPGQTVIEQDEVLSEIRVPVPSRNSRGCFLKLGRTRMGDLSTVSVAVRITFGANSKCECVRIVLGAVAPTPLRSTSAEDFLIEKIIDDQVSEKAGRWAMEDCKPITDVRASRDYRREMVRVLVSRAIRACANSLKL